MLYFGFLFVLPMILFLGLVGWITYRIDKRFWEKIDSEDALEDDDYQEALKQLDKEFPTE